MSAVFDKDPEPELSSEHKTEQAKFNHKSFKELAKRSKLLCVSGEMIIDLLNFAITKNTAMCLPATIDIPAGSIVLAVNTSFMTRTIQILICHESFDLVPEGQMPTEVFPDGCDWRYFKISPERVECESTNSLTSSAVDVLVLATKRQGTIIGSHPTGGVQIRYEDGSDSGPYYIPWSDVRYRTPDMDAFF